MVEELPALFNTTVVIVPDFVLAVALAAVVLLSEITTAPSTTPDTEAAAVAAAVWVAVTEVVPAPPATVIVPPVTVLLTAPVKLAVTVSTVPPLTVIESAVAVVWLDISVTVTETVPVAFVVPPIVREPPVVAPEALTVTFTPPSTVSALAANACSTNVRFCVDAPVNCEAPTAPLEVIKVTFAIPENGADAVLPLIFSALLMTKF